MCSRRPTFASRVPQRLRERLRIHDPAGGRPYRRAALHAGVARGAADHAARAAHQPGARAAARAAHVRRARTLHSDRTIASTTTASTAATGPAEQVRPGRALAARLPRRGRRDVRRQRAARGRDVRIHPRLSSLRARVGRLPAARGLLGLGQLCAAPGALRTRRPGALGALAALCAARPAHSAVL